MSGVSKVMLPVKHFVVRDKQGHATCDTLLSGVISPVKHFVVREGHATCRTLCCQGYKQGHAGYL